MSETNHTNDYSVSEEPYGIYAARMAAKDMRRNRREYAQRERNQRSAFMASARRKLQLAGWRTL